MNNSEVRKEELGEFLSSGLNLGIILFAGAVIGVWASEGQMHIDYLFQNFIFILIICVLAGYVLELLRSIPEIGLHWFRGTAIINWFSIGLFIFLVFHSLLSSSIRYMLIGDMAVLGIMWVGNYVTVNKIAKQLNKGGKGYALVVDLNEKPRTKEEFYEAIEAYCKKNHIVLEYVERDMPAIVKLNGQLNKVELNYYYTFGGPIYTLDFKTI